jgi:hypothetical protein
MFGAIFGTEVIIGHQEVSAISASFHSLTLEMITRISYLCNNHHRKLEPRHTLRPCALEAMSMLPEPKDVLQNCVKCEILQEMASERYLDKLSPVCHQYNTLLFA